MIKDVKELKRISDDYYVYNYKLRMFEKVPAVPIVIKGWEDWDFYATKDLDYPTRWNITIGYVGLIIGNGGKDIDEATKNCVKILNTDGEIKVLQVINQLISNNKYLSPRYAKPNEPITLTLSFDFDNYMKLKNRTNKSAFGDNIPMYIENCLFRSHKKHRNL